MNSPGICFYTVPRIIVQPPIRSKFGCSHFTKATSLNWPNNGSKWGSPLICSTFGRQNRGTYTRAAVYFLRICGNIAALFFVAFLFPHPTPLQIAKLQLWEYQDARGEIQLASINFIAPQLTQFASAAARELCFCHFGQLEKDTDNISYQGTSREATKYASELLHIPIMGPLQHWCTVWTCVL